MAAIGLDHQQAPPLLLPGWGSGWGGRVLPPAPECPGANPGRPAAVPGQARREGAGPLRPPPLPVSVTGAHHPRGVLVLLLLLRHQHEAFHLRFGPRARGLGGHRGDQDWAAGAPRASQGRSCGPLWPPLISCPWRPQVEPRGWPGPARTVLGAGGTREHTASTHDPPPVPAWQKPTLAPTSETPWVPGDGSQGGRGRCGAETLSWAAGEGSPG